MKEKQRKHVCDKCGVYFSKPAYLRQHYLSHTGERPFICPFDGCDKSYVRKDHLNRHLFIHEGKTFDCHFEGCGLKLTTQNGLHNHLKVHQKTNENVKKRKNENVCQFPGCGKSFKYPSALKYHSELHNVDSKRVEYLCITCEEKFSKLTELNEHNAKKHKKNKCPYCEKYIVRDMLNRHINRMHSNNEKESFPCSIENCNKSFSSAYNRDHHIKSFHFLERPFECPISGCSKKFSLKQSLTRHQKSFHDLLPIPQNIMDKDEKNHRKSCQTGRKRKSIFSAMDKFLSDQNDAIGQVNKIQKVSNSTNCNSNSESLSSSRSSSTCSNNSINLNSCKSNGISSKEVNKSAKMDSGFDSRSLESLSLSESCSSDNSEYDCVSKLSFSEESYSPTRFSPSLSSFSSSI